MSDGLKWLALCAALALGEIAGFAAARFADLWPLVAFAALLAALIGFGLALRAWPHIVVFLVGLALALGVASARARTLNAATVLSAGRPLVATFHVAAPPRLLPAKAGVRWVSFRSALGSVRVRVILPVPADVEPPQPGETWTCAGWLQRLKTDDYRAERTFWVKGSGTFARRCTPADPTSFGAHLEGWRQELSRRMGIGLEDAREVADLNRAILLGERFRIPSDDKDAFVAAGTIHVFAISGLHVMIVARLLTVLLALTGLPFRLHSAVLVPILWLYVLLTGASPSAVRAAAMATIQGCAPLAWRRADGLVAWSLTFLAVHTFDPLKLFDVGCMLSFAVMLGLVLWGRFVSRFIDGAFRGKVLMTLAAWSVGLPIAAHVFGRVTPGGLVSNLALIPTAGYSVGAGVLGLLASFVSERLAAHVNNFAALFTSAMTGISHAIAALPGANFEVEPWPIAVCLEWYAALGLLLYLLHKILRRRRKCL